MLRKFLFTTALLSSLSGCGRHTPQPPIEQPPKPCIETLFITPSDDPPLSKEDEKVMDVVADVCDISDIIFDRPLKLPVPREKQFATEEQREYLKQNLPGRKIYAVIYQCNSTSLLRNEYEFRFKQPLLVTGFKTFAWSKFATPNSIEYGIGMNIYVKGKDGKKELNAHLNFSTPNPKADASNIADSI